MKKTVSCIQTAAEDCYKANKAGKHLILIDTPDLEMAMEITKLLNEMRDFEWLEKGGKRSLDDDTWPPRSKAMKEYYLYLDGDQQALRSQLYTSPVDLQKYLKSDIDRSRLFLLLVPEKKSACEDLLREYICYRLISGDPQSPLSGSCVILYGNPETLSEDLKQNCHIVEPRFPKFHDLLEMLTSEANKHGLDTEDLEPRYRELAEKMAGLGYPQARDYIRTLMYVGENGKPIILDAKLSIKALKEVKKQCLLQYKGILTLIEDEDDGDKETPKDDGDELGGMKEYTEWIKEKGDRFISPEKYERRVGVPILKGVLLCGVPGCGKSEAGKILRTQWKQTMLRMSVDQLMGGYVGDSERNMRKALEQADAMAPCIMLVDELDKGFSGARSQGDKNNDTFQRMFGRFLTWMQEHKSSVFVFATANDISLLPREFFRSGRFDACVAVFMPTENECIGIFKEQMRRADKRRKKAAEKNGEPEPPDLFLKECSEDDTLRGVVEYLATDARAKFVTGADIEKIVTNALATLHADMPRSKQINNDIWVEALKEAIDDPRLCTQGGSDDGLNAIAASYFRLLRGNFFPASEELLIEKLEVTEEKEGKLKVKCLPVKKSLSPYDAALRKAIEDKLTILGPLLAQQERNRLCS